MGGGLMQLVAYGAQDIYLTGNPQITFFKVVYRRHTNFSMESIKQVFDGNADFGGTVSATISRNGDLVHRMYLEHEATFHNIRGSSKVYNVGLVERYGDSLIKESEIEIGGQRIDKHTSMWNRVYSDLTEFNPTGYFQPLSSNPGVVPTSSNGTLYQLMTGNGLGLNCDDPNGSGDSNEFGGGSDGRKNTANGFIYINASDDLVGKIIVNKIFLPLNFWFCRNPGLALPLISLQYHEVKIKMTFETHSKLITDAADNHYEDAIPGNINNVDGTPSFQLWCDYIYLDTDERRRFAQVSHEYLIEQLQYSENMISTDSPSIDLNFNHPVKELIWCMRNETAGDETADGGRNQPLTTTSGDATAGPVSLDTMGGNFLLKLNGHDRFKERDSKYFTRTQVWQHHTGYGSIPTTGYAHYGGSDSDSNHRTTGGDAIAVYSFALKPEEHQPSGTCNFSRIDNAQLVGSSLTVEADEHGSTITQVPISSDTNSDTSSTKLIIFAVNYNVLRIMSGMGGLAYSN